MTPIKETSQSSYSLVKHFFNACVLALPLSLSSNRNWTEGSDFLKTITKNLVAPFELSTFSNDVFFLVFIVVSISLWLYKD